MTTIISRSKDTHRVLKQHLGFSIKDLKMVINEIKVLLMNQRIKYLIKLDTAKMRVSFNF